MATTPELPRRFGAFTLLERIHESDMSEIYLAVADGAGLTRLVALKKPHALTRDPAARRLFLREIRLTLPFTHPNLLAIYEVGETEGQLFLAMELVRGRNLRQIQERLRKRGEALPPELALSIISEAASALHYAHTWQDPVTGERRPVIHRDFSPHNVMVSYDGLVKVIDFGIAKPASEAETITTAIRGKPAYMAPEQIRGEPPDPRVDIFALASVLYELLTGEKAFPGIPQVALEKIENADSCPPALDHPAIPPRLRELFGRCFRQDPAQRPQSLEEILDQLAAQLAMELPAGVRPSERLRSLMLRLFEDERATELQRLQAHLSAARSASLGEPNPEATIPSIPSLDLTTRAGQADRAEAAEQPLQSAADATLLELESLPLESARLSATGLPAARPKPSHFRSHAKPARPTSRRGRSVRPVTARPSLTRFTATGTTSTRTRRLLRLSAGIITTLLVLGAATTLFAPRDGSPPAVPQAPPRAQLRLRILPEGGAASALFVDGKPARPDALLSGVPGTTLPVVVTKRDFQILRQQIALPLAASVTGERTLLLQPVRFGTVLLKAGPETLVDIKGDSLRWQVKARVERLLLPPGRYEVRFNDTLGLGTGQSLQVIEGATHVVGPGSPPGP